MHTFFTEDPCTGVCSLCCPTVPIFYIHSDTSIWQWGRGLNPHKMVQIKSADWLLRLRWQLSTQPKRQHLLHSYSYSFPSHCLGFPSFPFEQFHVWTMMFTSQVWGRLSTAALCWCLASRQSMVSFLTGGVHLELLNTSNSSRCKPSVILPLCTSPNLAIFPDFSTRLPGSTPCNKHLSKYML